MPTRSPTATERAMERKPRPCLTYAVDAHAPAGGGRQSPFEGITICGKSKQTRPSTQSATHGFGPVAEHVTCAAQCALTSSTEERPWAHCCIRLCCVLRVAWRRRTLRVERSRCILTAENCLLLAEQPPLPTNQHCGAPMRRAVALLRNQSALHYVALHATNQSALYYVAFDVLCRDEALPSPAV